MYETISVIVQPLIIFAAAGAVMSAISIIIVPMVRKLEYDHEQKVNAEIIRQREERAKKAQEEYDAKQKRIAMGSK